MITSHGHACVVICQLQKLVTIYAMKTPSMRTACTSGGLTMWTKALIQHDCSIIHMETSQRLTCVVIRQLERLVTSCTILSARLRTSCFSGLTEGAKTLIATGCGLAKLVSLVQSETRLAKLANLSLMACTLHTFCRKSMLAAAHILGRVIALKMPSGIKFTLAMSVH